MKPANKHNVPSPEGFNSEHLKKMKGLKPVGPTALMRTWTTFD
jgi:hypothetical protein